MAPRRGRPGPTAVATAFIVATMLLVLAGPLTGKASAETIPIVFPLEKKVRVFQDYLHPRVGHLHQGTDLLAPRFTRELAVVGGIVRLNVKEYEGFPLYTIWLEGDDGHGYYYSHINNDTPGTDDGRGGPEYAYAPGLVSGDHVEQGQFIAYVGDSGNSEPTEPHLHFEIHETTSPDSPSIDPYESLLNAPLATKGAYPPLPQPVAGLVRLEQGDPRISYQGAWSTFTTASASGSSYKYAGARAKAVIMFTGTRLNLVATQGVNQGKVRVTVDDGTPELVNLYSIFVRHRQTVWSTGTLPEGPHTVTVEWTGQTSAPSRGATINMDAVDVLGTVTQAPVVRTYQQSDPRLSYLGSWSTAWSSTASGSSHRYSNTAGSSVTVRFHGTYLSWLAKTSPAYGMAKVTLDGGDPVLIDLYSAGTVWRQTVWETGPLDDDAHTVVIEWTGTKNPLATATNISIDAFEVLGTVAQAPLPTRVEQISTKLVYGNAWRTGWSSLASGGSHRYANVAGASVTVNFNGTYLAWLAKKSLVYGIAMVSVDGGDPVPVDLYSARTLWRQRVWDTGLLGPGDHTVTISWTGTKRGAALGTNISVDAFIVVGTLR